jgi:hypothetical protein
MFALSIILINKNILEKNYVINTLDEAHEEIIKYLAIEFNKLHINYPDNFNDFECEWFNYYSMDYIDNVFIYTIFDSTSNTFIKPFENQLLYDDILMKIEEIENKENKNYNIDSEISDDDDSPPPLVPLH